jgi:LysM repeat protein
MNPDRSSYTSASHEESTVRPRNRRLVSYGDENDSTLEEVGSSTSCSRSKERSPFSSRRVSPIPRAHPSRPTSSTRNAASVAETGYRMRRNDQGQINASSGLGLWESWSSLQGIASTLLGSDTQQVSTGKKNGGFKNALWRKPSKGAGLRPPTRRWGAETATEQTFPAGSKEERQAMILAKKRDALLLAGLDDNATSSAAHKCRDSDPGLSNFARSVEQDSDAFVYVHKVKAQDTLAGVMIRYQCQPAVFRKVNRLWPNDNIQTREHVFLPVEACAIRGRRIDGNYESSRPPAPEQSKDISSNHFDLHADGSLGSPSLNTSLDADPEYKHEYFVSIPGIPENVEIARIRRRTLGFFPPSRRKSQTFSDADIYSDSPKASLDVASRLNSISLGAPPSRNRTSRAQRSNSGSYFVDRLKGPGGVGTLRGSGAGGVVSPGPAADSLNKMFAHHLPNVAPRDSFDSVHSASSTGLENFGGVIEGWVRKVGTKLAGSVEGNDAYRQQSRMGDLIELESSGEAMEDQEHGGLEHLHGGVVTASDGPAPGRSSISRDLLKGREMAGITATEEALLREQFPPRGRMVDAQMNKRK